MRAKYIEKNWTAKITIENEVFEGEDFTGVDLNSPIFNNVAFRNCRFEKTKFSDGRLYHCHFESCVFIGVDLRNVTIGADGGLYKNCTFTKCDFRKGYFYQPAISGCFFDECKFKGTDFKASCFEDCKFKGKLEDVVFHGKYVSDLTQNSSVNTMKNIDFSMSIWKEICFDNCDLSSCIPPHGTTFSELLCPSPYHNDKNYLCSDIVE
ncbi:pentapeptide repeat-containing protein [Cronobacter dublinensis]|uniref:pentapeptide repeat-containing protein n=1 Tax=Cronobacter dublinensis TaxID=413497 RepID=UPI000CFC91AA|nr:pentapeptide repeat-containing protein [Cronobacter dublinensis]